MAKFRAWIPDGSGAYIAKELPGPSNWTQWLAAWRVFQAAAIMLDILPLASLQLYERHFERLVRLYPSAWHLIVMADEKATGREVGKDAPTNHLRYRSREASSGPLG